jgi:hypothetical protein
MSRLTSPKLPGNPRQARLAKTDAPDGDEAIGRQQRSDRALDAAILSVLAEASLPRWQIRQQLHEPESSVHRGLVRLRRQGLVCTMGRRSECRWGLMAYKDREPLEFRQSFNISTPGRKASVPAKPSSSWWLGKDREAFSEAAAKAHVRMQETGVVKDW